MKLYSVVDGPPSLGCRMTFKHLNIPYELIEVNYNAGEMFTDWYAKVTKTTRLWKYLGNLFWFSFILFIRCNVFNFDFIRENSWIPRRKFLFSMTTVFCFLSILRSCNTFVISMRLTRQHIQRIHNCELWWIIVWTSTWLICTRLSPLTRLRQFSLM